MKVTVHFQGFEGFEHHESFIRETAQKGIERFERSKSFDLIVTVKRNGTKRNFTQEEYECDINLKTDGLRGHMFYKKTSPDFYQAVRDAMKAAEKGLRRESNTRMARRRKTYAEAIKLRTETDITDDGYASPSLAVS